VDEKKAAFPNDPFSRWTFTEWAVNALVHRARAGDEAEVKIGICGNMAGTPRA